MRNKITLVLIIIFSMLSNGCGESEKKPYISSSSYREQEYASEVITPIRIIYSVSKDFVNNSGTGVLPNSIEQMEEYDFLRLDESIKLKWVFYLELYIDDVTGEIIGCIWAESTEYMKGGGGEFICFDAETETFSGYGQKSDCNC